MKQDVSDLLELAVSVYEDAAAKCSAEVSDQTRDLDTLRKRVKDEGISFLTITLPLFAKDFEKALADGCIGPCLFKRWKKTRVGGRVTPSFLRGMLDRIFDYETGRLHDESADTPILVESVRQVCLFFKKVELPCSPARDEAAIDNYIAVERDLGVFQLPDEQRKEFRAVCWLLWCDVLRRMDVVDLLPKHGPGATAERISGNQKYVWQDWYERLESYFPFFGTGITVGAAGWDEQTEEEATEAFAPFDFERVTFVQESDERPVRVTLVPKTLKSPRVIAIEPVCMQYAQQAIQGGLYDLLESDSVTGGQINFTDQSINQRLALAASRSGQMATIDLSDASDRVPLDLALMMFDSYPLLRDAVSACRSTHAELPDGRVIGPLVKFASMGSALCFPVEAMYFFTLCVLASLKTKNLPFTQRNARSVARGIYVYGDDLIVPHDVADAVLDCLQQYNCKVNWSKSFTVGKFRESCGLDAYNGHRVTPVYLRRMPPENRQQASEIVSWVATANALLSKGYTRTAGLMLDRIEHILGVLPEVAADSSGLGRVVPVRTQTHREAHHRWNRKLMRWETTAWVAYPVKRSDGLDGYSALSKSLLRLERQTAQAARSPHGDWLSQLLEKESLERGANPLEAEISKAAASGHPKGWMDQETTVLRGAVTLKRRWVPATI